MDLLFTTLSQLLNPINLLIIFWGVTAGLFVGAMPGLTVTMALAVLLPFTFNMQPLQGLVALGAVYMGAVYGGSFAAILLNTPGSPSSIATAMEGFPMSKKGRVLEALSVATVSSAIGGIVGVLFLLLLSRPLAYLSIQFGPAEYFWVAMLGFTLIASLSEGSLFRGLLGGVIGMLVGTMGVAPIGGQTRFIFGLPVLQGGVEMILALIGLFVIPELFGMAARATSILSPVSVKKQKGMPFGKAFRGVISMPGNLIRSCVIGEMVAIIPGAGGNIANLVAYNEAKRASKHPEKFGSGVIEGLVATESSNNVTVAGSMIPLLTLGIPGAPPDAIILGALMLHGLRPGLELFTSSAALTYSFILSMGLSAVALLPVGLLCALITCRIILRIPYYFLAPTVGLATILGTFALRNSLTDVVIMIVLGTVGYLFKQVGIAPAPIVLGLIFGQFAEVGLIQTFIKGGAFAFPFIKLFETPLSQILAGLVFLSACWPLITYIDRKGCGFKQRKTRT